MQLHVDFERPAGRIKPMHAVGQPPFNGGFLSFDFTPMKWLREAGIPYARLHDVGGAFGSNRFVDIPNLFPVGTNQMPSSYPLPHLHHPGSSNQD